MAYDGDVPSTPGRDDSPSGRAAAPPPAAHLLKALESTQIGVTISDLAGRIVWVNESDARIHGYSREELIGREARLYAAGGSGPSLSPETARDARSWKRERMNRRKDGSVFPVRLFSDVLLDSDGNPAGLVTTCEDVTEERRAAEALRAAGLRLSAVVEAQEQIARADLDPGSLVRVVAERLQDLCGADGALVEVPDGDGFVVRAATGCATPLAGLRFAGGAAGAAEATRTGEPFACPDARTEPRIDRDATRRSHAGSSLALPLFHGGAAVGAATVVARRGAAFGAEAVETLRLMGGSVSSALHHALEVEAERRLLDVRTVALAEREASYRLLFERNLAGVFRATADGVVLDANEAFARMLGLPLAALKERSLASLLPLGEFATHLRPRLAESLSLSGVELRLLHGDGGTVWALGNLTWLGTPSPDGAAIEGTLLDITDRKRMEERLVHDAFHDALTGLANRALFLDRLAVALRRSRRQKAPFAVLFADLDRFKLVNDSLGHVAGDRLLASVAQRLVSAVRHEDTVARLGGDEFAVLVDSADGPGVAEAAAEAAAARIHEALATPFALDGREVWASASIGIAIGPGDARGPEDLLRDADTALYEAKGAGKGCARLFEPAMRTEAESALALESDLRRGVERGEFLVRYQPILDLATRRVAGFEALLRWAHPTRGLLFPADFLGAAEETGLIVPLGRTVLAEAVGQLARWQAEFPRKEPRETLSMSVNLSARELGDVSLVDEVAAVLARTGVPPSSVTLELTEGILVENLEAAARVLSRLREIGVRVSIDDFGTGYSSLSYLHWLPLDRLKIDRSFVSGTGLGGRSREILRTITTLAGNLGMDVVAEGVETEDQLARLRDLPCDLGQGWLFAEALDPADASNLLRA